jgi:ATP-dependent exoDNAse (exonuclease V) alpha subunit
LKAAGRLGREKGLRAVDEGIDRPRTEFDLEVAIGDRLLFTKNDGPLGVKNGTLGTVVAFGSTSIRCQIGGDRPRIVDVDLTRYRNLTHGYAVTVHKAQGVTVDRAHVLAEPNMDRHGTYVALSRHRRNVQMHWAQDDFSTRGNMVDRLSRERLKDTTLDYAAGREVKPLVPVRDAGPLQRSVSREFSQAKSSSSSSTSRSERAAMTQWRSRKGGGLDFGRER